MKHNVDLVTPEIVRELLDYDPVSGHFTWRYRSIGWFDNEQIQHLWNIQYAGMRAGSINNAGYVKIRIAGRTYAAHRLAWLLATGNWPSDQIDHVDQVKKNNGLVNLRAVSKTENMQNMPLRKDNTSGFVGVRWHADRRKWSARIRVDSRIYNLGYFDTFEDAVAVRAAANASNKFHPNHGEKLSAYPSRKKARREGGQ